MSLPTSRCLCSGVSLVCTARSFITLKSLRILSVRPSEKTPQRCSFKGPRIASSCLECEVGRGEDSQGDPAASRVFRGEGGTPRTAGGCEADSGCGPRGPVSPLALRPCARTCEVAELRDEHGGAGQTAAGAPPSLGLTDQHRLLQVSDFLVVLLVGRRVWSLCTVTASSHVSGQTCWPAVASATGVGGGARSSQFPSPALLTHCRPLCPRGLSARPTQPFQSCHRPLLNPGPIC